MSAFFTRLGAIVLVMSLAACGGGSSSGGSLTLPSTPSSPSTPSQQSPSASFHLVIPNPTSTTSPALSARRLRPKFVSSATLGVRIVATNTVNSDALGTFANISPGSADCSTNSGGRTCTVAAAAFYGQTTFTITTYNVAPTANSVPVGAQVLGVGQVSADLIQGKTLAPLEVVLSAQVGSIGSNAFVSAPADGAVHSVPVVIDPTDFGNASLTSTGGSVTYANPITATLVETGGSGVSTLTGVSNGLPVSGTTVTLYSSADSVNISYNTGNTPTGIGSPGYYATATLTAPSNAAGVPAATPEVVQMAPMYVGIAPAYAYTTSGGIPMVSLGGPKSVVTATVNEAGSPPSTQVYTATLGTCPTAVATSATVTNAPAAASFTVTGGASLGTSLCTLMVSDGTTSAISYNVSNTLGNGSVTLPGGTITEFLLPNGPSGNEPNPLGITAGPDGNIWYADNAYNDLGYVSAGIGAFGSTQNAYAVTGPASFNEIATGPDGALWATSTASESVTRIETGVETGLPIATDVFGLTASPSGIMENTDGNMYVGEAAYLTGAIAQVQLGGASLYANTTNGNAGAVTGVARDAVGDLYGCEGANQSIVMVPVGNLDTDGTTTNITTKGDPWLITHDGSGNVWFTEQPNASGTNTAYIGMIASGATTISKEIALPSNSDPVGITLGPDGALWYVDQGLNAIFRITTAGVISPTNGYPIPSGASDIVTGPDGNLYFTETTAHEIGQLVP